MAPVPSMSTRRFHGHLLPTVVLLGLHSCLALQGLLLVMTLCGPQRT